MKRLLLILLLSVTCLPFVGQTIKYVSSYPEDGSEISSLEQLTLNFDLSEVYNQLGGTEDDWGICCNTFPYTAGLESMEKTITVYEGDQDGTQLAKIAKTIKPTHYDFVVGNSISITFPEFEIKSGQLYTVVIKYHFYAGKVGETSWTTSTKLDCQTNPIILQFYGSAGNVPSLSLSSCDISENNKYDEISTAKFSFNTDIVVCEDLAATLKEKNEVIATSTNIEVDAEDAKSIIVNFPMTPLYYGHEYNIVIPSGIVSSKENSESINREINIPVYGNSFRYFGLARGVYPSNGSISTLDEIVVPFNFPVSDSTTYGFPYSGGFTWTIYVYEGDSQSETELLSVEGQVGSDSKSLIFHPNYVFEPSSDYTFVIPEGEIKAYDLNSMNNSYLEDYISERVELHYSTPAVQDLPKWIPNPVNIKDNDELSELMYYIIDCPEYEYEETIYNTVSAGKIGDKGALYIITDSGEELVKTFPITRKTLNYESEIGNGELNGRYFVGEVNETLYEGNEYRVIWQAESFIVDNPFIGRYISNPEVAVTLKGATPTVNDFGLIANIDDRFYSHADVFSFVTESEVKAGEGAAMKLMDGEENVVEAPVYVSREANGYRAYADFGGKKLENGKTYDVVLPEGSVYATNGVVRNPEIRSAITSMSDVEYISVDLAIDGYASATYRMVKGQESTVDLRAGSDWQLESLTLDGTDVTADVTAEGLYVLPALEADATLTAAYAYAHDIPYDYTTGVVEPGDCPYALERDGEHLVITGLNAGDSITIYTLGGIKVTELTDVPADRDRVAIALQPSQYYIILINDIAIRYKH